MKPVANPNFLPTRWSLIAHAADTSSERSRDALNELCQAYWYPVYAYIRRKVGDPHQAEELTQDFFASALSKSTFAKADPAKGRFRTFILSCLTNFLHNARAHDHAQKRDARKVIAFDAMEAAQRYAAEPRDELSPDRLFERTLALELLRRAEAELEADRRLDGKGPQFDTLRPHLYELDDTTSLDDLAAQLGIGREGAKSALGRLRDRFHEILRGQAAQLVTHREDAKDELIALQNAL